MMQNIVTTWGESKHHKKLTGKEKRRQRMHRKARAKMAKTSKRRNGR